MAKHCWALSTEFSHRDWLGRANLLITLKGLMGVEFFFNGITFHHHFYAKTKACNRKFVNATDFNDVVIITNQ